MEPTVKVVVINESGQEVEESKAEYTFGHITEALAFQEAVEVLADEEYKAGGGELDEEEDEEEDATQDV
jgi:hypothetical protein